MKKFLITIICTLFLFLHFACKDDGDDIFYTVTIFSNGGTNYAPIQIKAGDRIPLNKLYPEPIINDGGTFEGWYADAAFLTEFDFETPITEDISLYVKWFYDTFTVTYVMNGATDRAPEEIIKGRRIEPGKPTYDGHIFVAWYEDAGFTKVFHQNNPVTSDLTLYARWEKPSPTEWFSIDSNGLLAGCNPPDGTPVVVIPEGVKTIPAWFVLANGLNKPGKPGFDTGKNIQEFILPESLEAIGEGAFKFAAITSIIIPPGIKELESVSFQDCDQLVSFTFAAGSQLEIIKSAANNDPVIAAPSLETIIFPPSLEFVGKYALDGCTALKSVTFEREESAVIFYDYLPGGGVWLFGGYFPARIAVPSVIKEAFLAEMRMVMQDYEYEKMSEITEGY